MRPAWLFWNLLFGCVGLAYFVYGRKQRAPVPLLCGLALMTFPWFVDGIPALVATGVVLSVVPYFARS